MGESRDDHAAERRPLSAKEGGFLALLRWLPSSLLSAWAGKLAGLTWPAPLRKPVCLLFGRAVGVDFTEVRDPLKDFRSIQAFFTRALRPGVRPVDSDPRSFVSPCDGAWGASGRVEAGTLLQAKGRTYRLAEMIADPALARHFEGGQYATLYLSPRDYHRFHAPCDMWIRRAVYVPGSLWPVNRLGIEGVDGLFARNERLVAQVALSEGASPESPVDLCIVAVGAMMVGKVKLGFDDLTTRSDSGGAPVRDYPAPGVALEKAQEWGHFEFGSTLVVVAAPGRVSLDSRPPGTSLRLGEAMGRLARSSSGSD
ncbi:MAG: phosphatidylserine decarboxylase [Spirochaeta sp.]|nr:phosphatidylserine decarboxylase [Spirochaeta sp.]RPG03012.1 MAG: phosphatidylserine decarboxylase [Proteobacteria bacterium TMED72]